MSALATAGTTAAAPATVSARRHLRDGLPEIYRQSEFAMRFVLAFEQVLDPIVAALDSLPAHFDADLAPGHALAGIAAWLGVDDVEALDDDQRREVLRHAGELGRLRGTRAGLQLALELLFPGIALRIEDRGGVLVSEEAGDPPPSKPVAFDVLADEPLTPSMQRAVDQAIERWKPANAQHRLRVRKKP